MNPTNEHDMNQTTHENTTQGRAGRMIECMRRSGLRVTPQREAIVRLLADDSSHPSAESVHARAALELPWMSKATVYNTLNSLIQAGVIQELDLGHERRFDGRTDEPHAHLVCRVCGRIEDVDLPEGFDIAGLADAGTGFRAEHVQVKLTGTCRACAAGPEASPSPCRRAGGHIQPR